MNSEVLGNSQGMSPKELFSLTFYLLSKMKYQQKQKTEKTQKSTNMDFVPCHKYLNTETEYHYITDHDSRSVNLYSLLWFKFFNGKVTSYGSKLEGSLMECFKVAQYVCFGT